LRWADLVREQPRLAALGATKLIEPGVVLVATIRSDGTPRLSANEPLLFEGDLVLSMLWGSTKAQDLLRDGRILVHSIVTSRSGGPGEFKIRGCAILETDRERHERYAETVAGTLGWRPVPGRFHLFAVAIEHVAFVRYDDASGDQYTAMWPPAREFVRRATTPTSVAAPEPWSELFDHKPEAEG
jgi:hypothetical protein